MWCSAADTHLELLDPVVSGACFSTGSVCECNIAHRRSATVLCIVYKIRCKPMHLLHGALPVPYVKVRVMRDAFVAHRYTYEPPRCRTLSTAGFLFLSEYLCGTILLTQCSMCRTVKF